MTEIESQSQKEKTRKRLNILFYALLIAHLAVVLIPSAFVSHDGPSHLYNAKIINALLFSDGTIYHQFHQINPNWLQPNLLSYLFLSGFQLVFDFLFAEKLTVVLYMILLAFGFRRYLKSTVAHANWYALLIFPFLLNVVLFWGFYNFLFGLALFFYVLASYEKWRDELKVRHWLALVGLSLLVYFSHALVFVFLGLYVLIREAIPALTFWLKSKKFNTETWKNASFMVPGSVLFLLYLAGQNAKQEGFLRYSFFNRIERLIFKIESLSFSGYAEGSFVVPLFVILFILSVFKIRRWRKDSKKKFSPVFWIFCSYTLALFFAPDAEAGGSIIVLRLNLIFFLFWLISLAQGPINKWVKSLILLYTLISLPLLYARYQVINACALQVDHVTELAKSFAGSNGIYSTVYHRPVTRFVGGYQVHSYFDLLSNIDQYIALDHECLSLHNYEADRPIDDSYFPITWKDTSLVKTILTPIKEGKRSEYIDLDHFISASSVVPDFVLEFGDEQAISSGQDMWNGSYGFVEKKVDSLGFLRVYFLSDSAFNRREGMSEMLSAPR